MSTGGAPPPIIGGEFALNKNPDPQWDREFTRLSNDDERVPDTIRVARLNEQKHPGLRSTRPPYCVLFQVRDANDIPTVVGALDENIEKANVHFRDVVLPARESERRDAQDAEDARKAEQARIDAIASQVLPPT